MAGFRESLVELKARLAAQAAALQEAAEIRQRLEAELAGRKTMMEELRAARDRALRERDQAVQDGQVLQAEINQRRRTEMKGDSATATSVDAAPARAAPPGCAEGSLPRRPSAAPSKK